MIVSHVAPEGWEDTGEAGLVQPSHVAGLVHAVTFEPSEKMPAGAVLFFALAAAPIGWLECNGALVSRAAYAALFAAIGTTFGAGDGVTTFQLPELRGEFIRGLDSGRGVDPGRALGSAQGDLVKDHKHMFDVATVTGSYSTYNGRLAQAQDGSGSFTSGYIGQSQASGGAENRPRNVALLPCISTG